MVSRYIINVTLRATELEFRTSSFNVYPLIYICKHHVSTQEKCLIELVAHHSLETVGKKGSENFVLVYLLLNVLTGARLRVSTVIGANARQAFTQLFSVSSLFKGANWMEREV